MTMTMIQVHHTVGSNCGQQQKRARLSGHGYCADKGLSYNVFWVYNSIPILSLH